jgi:hypothetical protein
MPATADTTPKFAVGDRVAERYGWPQHGRPDVPGAEPAAVKRLGVIAAITTTLPNGRGEHSWQYAVRWDGQAYVERGYLGAGLIRVFSVPPIVLGAGVGQ